MKISDPESVSETEIGMHATLSKSVEEAVLDAFSAHNLVSTGGKFAAIQSENQQLAAVMSNATSRTQPLITGAVTSTIASATETKSIKMTWGLWNKLKKEKL